MTVKFTSEERAGWIKFCEEVAEDLGIKPSVNFNELTDGELDRMSDWYYDLTGK